MHSVPDIQPCGNCSTVNSSGHKPYRALARPWMISELTWLPLVCIKCLNHIEILIQDLRGTAGLN
eukprot:11253636-Heterocapsa_arctica.AAC.1